MLSTDHYNNIKITNKTAIVLVDLEPISGKVHANWYCIIISQ